MCSDFDDLADSRACKRGSVGQRSTIVFEIQSAMRG